MSTLCASCDNLSSLNWYNNLPLSICRPCRKNTDITINTNAHYYYCQNKTCYTLISRCWCNNKFTKHNNSYCDFCDDNNK